jgi:primosomal protein N' (replication factor Y) (superfamily II helicase)
VSAGVLVEVALPLPLPPLTYRAPAHPEVSLRPGVRVLVPVSRRRLTGVIVGTPPEAPEGVEVREVLEVLDAEPVLTTELLSLARFTAAYYLAPIGEVLRSMLPPDLEPWGRQRVRLTDRGALAVPRSPLESEVFAALRERGPLRASQLQGLAAGPELADLLARLRQEGRILLEGQGNRTGGRYRSAFELAPGKPQELLERCGRSAPGRQVVELLLALGRPASQEEILSAVGCSAGPLRRLVRVGVLRGFTEVRRLDLGEHHMQPRPTTPMVLRTDQQRTLEALREAVDRGGYQPFLLAGVTGSGKTEVYLRAASHALEKGRGVLLLVPEIALVPALAGEARRRFGPRLAVLHSGLSAVERRQEWERVRSGEAQVVLGARSALFAPVVDLGLVVVDEEQDPSYKQDSVPRYHGRDLALVRSVEQGAVAVLASATPSLESRYNVQQGKLGLLELTRRVGQGSLPDGILVDLRRESAPRRPGEVVFSQRLVAELEERLAAGDQVILLRNRRGYAPLLLCRACGEDHRCDDCGLPRTYHRRAGALLCHYCGSRRPIPQRCPACGEAALEPIGAGTERVEERFAERFPGVSVATLDRDAVRRPGGAAAILERFARGEAQVLVGTQMVSKGHHFPRVALAAVLAADSYLSFPDFRAVERTYSLLVQLAGRAGRGDQPGRVVIQTYHPDHYAIRAALGHHDAGFAEEEMRFRRVFHYPPFTRMVLLLVRDSSRERARDHADELARRVEAHSLSREVRVTGPAPAPLERLRGRWRYQILLRSNSGRRLRRLLEEVLAGPSRHDLTVDVDPYDLM